MCVGRGAVPVFCAVDACLAVHVLPCSHSTKAQSRIGFGILLPGDMQRRVPFQHGFECQVWSATLGAS